MNKLFKEVIRNNLCSGCGTCIGVCPVEAIKFDYNSEPHIKIDKNKCIKCNLCYEVCPGKGIPLDAFTKKLKTSQQEYNVDIGNYKQFLVGYAENEFIRRKSASGGIATSLLIYALDKKIVDKVIIVTNDEHDIAKPIVKITDSREDVLKSMQSKYVQVPLNKVLKEILKSDCRYAIVGLPCHLEGLYLAQKRYKKLSDQIVFKIGLFCGYSYPYECVNTLLKRMKLKREDVDTFLGWREGDCYPGFFSVKLKNGKTASISFADEHNINVANYALFRCFLCIDGLSQLADISLGDTTDATRNNSFIISRTERGSKLLKSAKTDRYIEYHTVSTELALSKGIVPFMLREKRYKVLSIIQYFSKKNIPVPIWDIKGAKISAIDRINGILRLRMVIFIRKPIVSKFLKSHPKFMEIAGGFIYHLDISPKHMIGKVLTKIRGMWFSKSWKHIKKNKDDRLCIGLVGVGGWGSQYVNILQKSNLFDLRACFDVDKNLLQSVCSKIGCLSADSIEELLLLDDLQAVVIATPNFLHYEQCIKAIKAGKHVFVEKPITNTIKEAEEIYRAAKERNIIVSVGHNVRRRPEFRIMKKLIKEGKIGKVIMVEANNSRYVGEGREASWRLNKDTCPGGPLLQLGIHHIDTLRYLFGEIIEVKAYLKNEYFKSGVPDTVLSILLFKSGVLGYLGTNYVSKPSFTMRVYGTKGNLIVEDRSLYLQKDMKRKKIETKPVNTLKEQIEEFGGCIVDNTEPEVGAKEAIENIAVVEAVMKTVKEKGKTTKNGE